MGVNNVMCDLLVLVVKVMEQERYPCQVPPVIFSIQFTIRSHEIRPINQSMINTSSRSVDPIKHDKITATHVDKKAAAQVHL